MSTIHYFAYGSNMSTPRLRYRVPGCRFEFVARLPNYKLCFHKRSKDGSAKCNAFRTAEPTDAVIGVVYEIPTNEKPALDRAEGLGAGYHEEIVPVLSPEGEKVTVHAYIADASFIDDILQPYSWYKNFVLAGAEEHRLPAEYVESRIGAVHAIRDPDPQREQARRAEIKAQLACWICAPLIRCLWAKIDTEPWSGCRARSSNVNPGEGDAEWPVG